MSKRYAVTGSNASGSSNKTLINVIGSTAIRPIVYDLILGCSATPGDIAAKFQVARTTAVGTAGSSPTPLALDPGDPAAVSTAGTAHSAEPTYAATNFLVISMNQRATFRWVAAPGGELIGSSVASNGVGLQLVASGSALVFDGTVNWWE